MVRLFLVVLGGRVDGCHIELHDVRFVAGATIDDTLPQLREQWFGRRRGLHIDSWLALDGVAGWRLQLRRQPYAGPERLWFVNGGGYDPAALAELHSFRCWWPAPGRRPGPRPGPSCCPAPGCAT